MIPVGSALPFVLSPSMSLFITSLNSGSNGNCYYIGNENEAVLVDVGISCREVEKRLKDLGLSMQKVKAVFVSHEHSDHIRGLGMLSNKYGLPVYITAPTLRNGRLYLNKELIRDFTTMAPVQVGDLLITAFPKIHDAADPYSFTVSYKRLKVGVFTDIGAPCDQLARHFSQCHAVFLESNYDTTMLDKGNYPYYLKSRIRGGQGHLSNDQALELFRSHRSPSLTHLLLSHLSKNNNCPKLVEELFAAHAEGVQIVIASRYAATPVYEITGSNVVVSKMQLPVDKQQAQLSFFKNTSQ
ncbi:MAG: metallo-beta-lactamase [Flaviaesturariibacter sp.]|nr:metallo-beta-lactamase [Flaviaesturariibacter sp.]